MTLLLRWVVERLDCVHNTAADIMPIPVHFVHTIRTQKGQHLCFTSPFASFLCIPSLLAVGPFQFQEDTIHRVVRFIQPKSLIPASV